MVEIDQLTKRLKMVELARRARLKESQGKRLAKHESKWIADVEEHFRVWRIPLHLPVTGIGRGYHAKLILQYWDNDPKRV